MNYTGLFLLPSLFYYTPDREIKYCWNNKYKNSFNQTLFDEPTTKFVFGILNGRVWNSKFEEKMSKSNISSENSDELNKENIECDDDDKINKKTYEHLNVHSFNLYMYTLSRLFQKAESDSIIELTELTLINYLIKWKICVNSDNSEIYLKVYNKHNTEWDLIASRFDNYCPYEKYSGITSNTHKLIAGSLFNNNDIVILTTFGILIYTFSENDISSISLNYFYFMELHSDNYESGSKEYMNILQNYKRIFSRFTLPFPNYDSFRLDGWVNDVINNKSSFLKYGVEILSFAIKEHKLELIDDIYKKCMTYIKEDQLILLKYGVELLIFAIKEHKLESIDDIYKNCMTYFKEDPINNNSFLSIITSVMPLLDEYYPEYILKYSSETNMIIDSFSYSIEHQYNNLQEHQYKNLHLYSFSQSPQIVNLSRSLLWTKYHYKLKLLSKTSLVIIFIIQALIILLTFPLFLATFYILLKYNFVNTIFEDLFTYVYQLVTEDLYFAILKKVTTATPTITFMIPYINFINYSKNYNWFLELIKPQPSSFTKTINRNIYKTWNGEALINFKWNAYGKYYYAIIWIFFMALLGCFTAAATIPQKYINEEVKQQLFIVSIILGSIHLIFEIRQFFYNITKWFYNFWNIFGKFKCLI
jgi:hypothetical protein